MMKYLVGVSLVICVTVLPRSVSAREEAQTLAACAWENVPSSASQVSEKRARKNQIYDDLDSKNAGPFYRIYAACMEEKRSLVEAVGDDKVSYHLIRELRRSKPKQIASDLFLDPIFRCEAHFVDQPKDSGPAMVWWSFGSEMFSPTLGERSQLFNSQVSITVADLLAVEKRGNGAANMANLLKQTEEQEQIEAETYAEGMESGKAFRIKPNEANTSCRVVAPDGSLTNA